MLTAVGARLKPITIMTGPTTTGGSKCISHPVPLNLIANQMSTYITPLINNATNMSPKPCEFNPVMIGVINAKLEPKYAGIFAFVMCIDNNVLMSDASKEVDLGHTVT